MERIPRAITEADSAGEAVEKAAGAELARCYELREHYVGVAALATWLDSRPTLLLDGDASQGIAPLLSHAFQPGRAGFGRADSVPETITHCLASARSLIARFDEAIHRTIPQARAAPILDSSILAKAKAVVAEDNSLTALQRESAAIRTFAMLLAQQPWGVEFLSGTPNPWSSLLP
ncbi:MAG: hypothetical protein ACJA07_001479 [Rhodococcus sp. (in: high G+C Gram-positive bacteria)]|jgi:hypothetical protein